MIIVEVKLYYTEEEVEQAKKTSLTDLMRAYNCNLIQKGNTYVWDEYGGHDSFTIHSDDRSFYIYREGFYGTQIDFLTRYQGMNFKEAV